MIKCERTEKSFTLPMVALTVGMIFIIQLVMLTATPMNAEFIGDENCISCHEDVGEMFQMTPHGLANQPGKSRVVSCESCHDAGSVHAETGEVKDINNPSRLNALMQQKTCNSCHGEAMSAFGDSHSDVADGCSDCHSIHSTGESLLKAQGEDLCFGCHTEVRGQFAMSSHHPVLEDRMECADCHQVHGSEVTSALDNSMREQCMSCHIDKQGPFVFEHEPVNEDCSICHNPHGSVADNLLIQAEPFVCLSCHPMHFHTSLTGYDGDFTAPVHPDRGGTSTLEGFKPAMLTKCTQCHTEIHGTDLPAQSISGPGSLTR